MVARFTTQIHSISVAEGHLLKPNMPSMENWGCAYSLALIFTATVTPFEVAFVKPSLSALFWVNRVVDIIFVADMSESID